MDAGFDRQAGQQLAKQLPEQWGPDGMAREHLRQENREGPPAAAALSAIGTKDPVASAVLASGGGEIVAVKFAMPV